MSLEENKEFALGDWGESDGIGECEEIIKASGGKVTEQGTIILYKDMELTNTLRKAADYLCNEWDYALEWKEDRDD